MVALALSAVPSLAWLYASFCRLRHILTDFLTQQLSDVLTQHYCYFMYEHFIRYCHVIRFISMVIRLSFSVFDIAYLSLIHI